MFDDSVRIVDAMRMLRYKRLVLTMVYVSRVDGRTMAL